MTFGALMFSTIMTIRQFLSLLLSSIFFLHPLTIGQWTGATVVFGVLYYKESLKKKSHSSHGPADHAGKSSNLDLSHQPLSQLPPPYSSVAPIQFGEKSASMA